MFSQQKSTRAKKLVITGLKVKPQLPTDFEEVSWLKLKHAVQAVHQRRRLNCSLEELYRCVEDMCIHNMSAALYDKLERECDQHIAQSVNLLSEKLFLNPVEFLTHMEEVWELHCHQMKKIGSIFLYLDRTYVLTSSSVKSLFEMGLKLFCMHLSNLPEVERHTLEGILMMIESERSGFLIDRILLKNLLNMFSLLGIYKSNFQGPFLEKTEQFYQEESEKNISLCDVPAYLSYCENRLSQEHDRSEQYLDRSTQRPLLQCVEEQLLCARMDTILTGGFHTLMDDNKVDDLARLFNLCRKIQALDQLNEYFKGYIKDRGSAIMANEENDMVLSLLGFKRRLDHVLMSSFQVINGDKNNQFQQSLKDGFEKFINQKESKPAELTAKFIDAKLKTGGKGQSEEDLELILDQVLTIFRFIQGKDVFEAFYKNDLAKRLLMNKSASFDAEKSMISKLREECGSKFTNKFEGMFKDTEISKDIMIAFRSSSEASEKISNLTSDMNVLVLTCGIWPSYPVIDARLPDALEKCQQIFEEFYLQKHNGRRLQWHNSLGTCLLKARFDAGTKELQVSLLQAAVLCLFNDVDTLTYKDIEEGTGVTGQDLNRLLQSLSCGKVRVLSKSPASKEVKPEDAFTFDSHFTDARFRIRLNAFQMKESAEESTKVNDYILQDRQYQIDAAIVRIMKMRNTLSHKLLISELATQLQFPFKTADIKKRIESLIERDYMDRAPEDPSIYKYVA